MSRLVDERWIAPRDAGPSRRRSISVLVGSLILLAAWSLFASGNLDRLRSADDARQLVVVVADDGTATLDGSPVATELRTRGATAFLVIHAPGVSTGDEFVEAVVRAPAGVDPERVATRLLQPTDNRPDTELLVTLPARALTELPDATPTSGPLDQLTGPLDARIAAARADEHRFETMRDGWWWILPLGVFVSAGLPLLLWRGAARRFFSMRVPGPGTDAAAGPPSQLSAISAAAIVAGSGPVDVGDAFAGHVLDLVERRQLVARRTLEPALGAGVIIGLARAEEDDVVRDDPAVTVLRSITLEDGITVPIPDSPRRRPVPDPETLGAWDALVDARVRFERLVDRPQWRLVFGFAAAAAVLAIVGILVVIFRHLPGADAAGWLLAALGAATIPGMLGWAIDARSWRRVTRARRTERAQWLAWTGAVGADDGPALNQRNLPLLVAAGRHDRLVPDYVGADAVGLDAVTMATIATLRALAAEGIEQPAASATRTRHR